MTWVRRGKAHMHILPGGIIPRAKVSSRFQPGKPRPTKAYATNTAAATARHRLTIRIRRSIDMVAACGRRVAALCRNAAQKQKRPLRRTGAARVRKECRLLPGP